MILRTYSIIILLFIGNGHSFRNVHCRLNLKPLIKVGGDISIERYATNFNSVDLSSLISSSDQYSLYASVAMAGAIAMKLERDDNNIVKVLSGPVTAMLLTSICTNVGILPTQSYHISLLQSFVVKLATPLLLLGADLRKIFRETGILLKTFVLGSFATVFGSVVSFLLYVQGLNQIGLNGDSWKICSALTAKNIGGGLNFISVVDALQVSSPTVAAGLAVDNVVGLLYFPCVSYLLDKYDDDDKYYSSVNKSIHDIPEAVVNHDSSKSLTNLGMDDVESMLSSIAISLVIISISEHLSKFTSIPSTLLSISFTVFIATVFSNQMKSFAKCGESLGKLLLYFFFGSVGITSGKLTSVISTQGTGSLFLYGLTMYIIHLFVIIFIGKYNNIPMSDILIASNANIGNAATASSFAASKGKRNKILPALLVGTFGNTIASFVAVWIGKVILQRISNFNM